MNLRPMPDESRPLARFPFGEIEDGNRYSRERLWILLMGHDRLMLLPGDATLLTVAKRGPLLLRQDRPWKPRHVQGEVLDLAKDVVG
jgi:hypothetical protein